MLQTSTRDGHLFLVRGDLTRIDCDARLIPTDADGNVTRHWWQLFEGGELVPSVGGWKAYRNGSAALAREGYVRLPGRPAWLMVTGHAEATPEWLVESVLTAVRQVAAELEPRGIAGRRIIALPLPGTGAGGLRHKRGGVLTSLLPALAESARELGVDIVIVLADERDAAAAQHLRADPSFWCELEPELTAEADALGRMAADGELALFLGAGVSVPLRLPSWQGLVDDLRSRAGLPAADEDLPSAAQEAVERLDAAEVHDVLSGLAVDRCALAHALLAGLGVREVITTNYDTAFETAVGGLGLRSTGRIKVLTRSKVEPGTPWLLKLHGDARHPDGIVLTSEHYAAFGESGNPLRGMVQTLMLTSHLLFVGYSLIDETFVRSAEEVRAVLVDAVEKRDHLGTVLPVTRDDVMRERCGSDLRYLPMPADDVVEGARLLEVFLDRVSWAAAQARHTSMEHLLDERYDDIPRRPEDEAVRDLARGLLEGATSDVRRSRAWEPLARALEALGAKGC